MACKHFRHSSEDVMALTNGQWLYIGCAGNMANTYDEGLHYFIVVDITIDRDAGIVYIISWH